MAFPLGTQTLGALVKALAQSNTHTELGTLFFSLGVGSLDPGKQVNKETRAHTVLLELQQADDDASPKAALALARQAAQEGAPKGGLWGHSAAEWWQPLLDALAADGWEFDPETSRLTPTIPGISIPEELTGLEADLDRLGWTTAALHFRQAARGFAAGEWESANSQLRSFLEDFLPRMAEALTDKPATNPGAAIQRLEKGSLLTGERDFLKGLWALSNERGSHAGESNKAEASFRLMIVTAAARFLLSRLP